VQNVLKSETLNLLESSGPVIGLLYIYLLVCVVSAGWELAINAFAPGQVLKEYC
jgi:hypothetical protein